MGSVPVPPVQSAPTQLIGQALPKPSNEILQAAATESTESMSVLDRIRAAAGPKIHNLEAKRLGRDGVIIRYDAPSDTVAEQAAKAISELAELKPYTITFDVIVGKSSQVAD